MPYFIFTIALFTSLTLKAASVTVPPFKLELELQVGYQVNGEIELACRYERFVFGDSAQYETFTKAPSPLLVESSRLNGQFQKITIKNLKPLFFEYDRPFKYGKECRASYRVEFISKDYALGYGTNPLKPISFVLSKGFYDYQEGEQVWDLGKIKDYLHNTTYSFSQRATRDALIIRILQDGHEASTSPWVHRAVFNPQTGAPYRPQTKLKRNPKDL